jgi:subtilisin family serine protease
MRIPAIALITLLAGAAASSQTLSPRFQTVYIASMANSLDQHLANRLTSSHVLWVVLQPASADAVLTDNLDEDFWTWLDKTYPGPTGPMTASAIYRSSSYPATSSKQHGTIFLIDPRKRVVLWSTYELPKNSSPAELDRSAVRISNQLRTAFGKK